jgi:glycosyltransferase involved in cell wall biosynthesis
MKTTDSDRISKLAILQSHPIQYFSPLYQRLAKEENIDLTVYYCSRQGVEKYYDKQLGINLRWDTPLLDGYRYRFLPDTSGSVPSTFKGKSLHPAVVGEILRGGYDALWMYGYKHPTYLLAIAAAKMNQTALLIRTETHPKLARLKQPTLKNRVRTPMLRFVYQLFDGALAIGTLNAEHYRDLGMADDKIFLVPYSVNNHLFTSNNHWDEAAIRAAKFDMGIPLDKPVILFVGKLLPNKEPMVLLAAFQKLQRQCSRLATLVYVGEGELRSQLEHYCIDNDVKDVVFAGFVNQTNVNRYYAVADILVLASIEETWGLVLNEAMCAKNAVIVSNAIGAASDLVLHGENGFIFPVGDTDALSTHLATLVGDPELCRRMGERSLEIINRWSLEEDIIGIQQALSYLRERK